MLEQRFEHLFDVQGQERAIAVYSPFNLSVHTGTDRK
jgi:hypothetical protein